MKSTYNPHNASKGSSNIAVPSVYNLTLSLNARTPSYFFRSPTSFTAVHFSLSQPTAHVPVLGHSPPPPRHR